MEGLWLQLHYKDKAFDYRVTDIDKMQLLDLIPELEVQSLRQSVLISETYDMHYLSMRVKRKIHIRSDSDLVTMFTDMEGVGTIDVYLTETINPIKQFALVAELKRNQKEEEERKQREVEEIARREREADALRNVNPIAIEIPIINVNSQETEYVCVTLQESQFVVDGAPPQTQQSQLHQSPLHQSPPRPSRQKKPRSPHQKCPTSDRFAEQPTAETRPSQKASTQQTPQTQPQSKRKVPKTTANRKKTYVPKSKQVRPDEDEGESSGARPKRTIIRPSSIVHLDSSESDSEDFEWLDNSDDDGDGSESSYDWAKHYSDSSDDSGDDDEHPFALTLGNVADSDDEVNGVVEVGQYLDRVYQNGTMYVPQQWGTITLKDWLIFVSKECLVDVISDYCVQEGFSVVVLKSDKNRYTAVCSGENCTWQVHASRLPDNTSWAIKKITGEHIEFYKLHRNPMATSLWMCKKLLSQLKANPNMPVRAMTAFFMEEYGLDVCTRTMYKVRDTAVDLQNGGHEKSYDYLAAYVEVIKTSNPGSWALITWHKPAGETDQHFKAIFVSFSACISGFLRGCRPIIGIDGCHLKGTYKGILLSALSLDGNNNIICIAYAIVGKEKTETWTYFFRNLRIAFEKHGCTKTDWTFISDRMKGIEPALVKEFPRSSKRVCAQHLYKNFKDKFSGPTYHDLFWRAAKSTSLIMFNKAMAKVAEQSPAARNWLLDVDHQWSQCQFDPEVACHHNTSNFVESWNSVINDLRELPVFKLLEGIRTYCMDKYAERMELADKMKTTDITPYAKGLLETNCAEATRYCTIHTLRCMKGLIFLLLTWGMQHVGVADGRYMEYHASTLVELFIRVT